MGRRLAEVALATASSTVCAHGRSQPRLRHLEKSIAFKIGLGRLRPLHAFVGVAAILISVRHGCPRLLVTSWSSPLISFLLSPFDGVELKSFCSASKDAAGLRQKTQTRLAAQSSRLAVFGGRGMSFNIRRGTLGRLAIFTAIRNGSSRVSSFAVDCKPSDLPGQLVVGTPALELAGPIATCATVNVPSPVA